MAEKNRNAFYLETDVVTLSWIDIQEKASLDDTKICK